jgi:hypothetical protein
MRSLSRLLLVMLPHLSRAQYRGRPCSLDILPIVLLSKNRKTGNFTVVKRLVADATDLEDGQFRLLEEAGLVGYSEGNLRRSSFPGLTLSNGNTEDTRNLLDEDMIDRNATTDFGNMTLGELFYARECNCFEPEYETVYCPFATYLCQAPSWRYSIQKPGCMTEPKGRETSRNIFQVLVIWYSLLFACICGTGFGRSLIDYMLFCCFPGWNRFVATRMLRRNPDRAHGFIRNSLRRRRQMLERRGADHAEAQIEGATGAAAMAQAETEEEKPTSLALRTKLYKGGLHRQRGSLCITKDEASSIPRRMSFSPSYSSEHGEYDEDDDENCTICFAPLLDGDRVGALPCDHIFHAECLKMWLQRRNVCPLCQTKDVATPRFDRKDEHTSSTDVEGSSSLSAEENTSANGEEEEDSPSA